MVYRGVIWLRPIMLLILSLAVLPAWSQDDEMAEPPDTIAAGATQYIELKPAFVTNFGGPGKLRYLKTDITLRVAATGVPAIRHHMSQIRHVLIMLLSRQGEEDISSMEGKELLRQRALEEVRALLIEEDGQEQVVDLLFGSFIVQQ